MHLDEGFPLAVGDRVTVGHSVTLHGCTIEDDTVIGIGATVLNGARGTKGSVVAAGSLVPEGMEVPPSTDVLWPGGLGGTVTCVDLVCGTLWAGCGQFFIDDLLKSGCRLSTAEEDSVDEKSGRYNYPGAGSQLNILVDLRLVALAAQASIELLVIQF